MKEIAEYDFKSEYKRERNPLLKIKLQALHHLQSGKLLKDVADIVLYDETAVIPFAKIKAGPFALSNRYSPSWKIKNLIFMNASKNSPLIILKNFTRKRQIQPR